MRGVASGTGLLLILAGVPIVLVQTGATPDLRGLMGILDHPGVLGHRLRGPLTDTGLGRIIVLAAWMAWMYVTLCVLVDVTARLRGRVPLRMPGSRRIQTMVTGLVGASLAIVPAPRASHLRLHASPAVAALPMAGAPSQQNLGRLTGAVDSPEAAKASAPTTEDGAAAPAGVAVPATETRIYVVRPGDTLWSIAERELGSPFLWPQLGDLNRGRPQPDGNSLTDDNWLLPGWSLVIPGPGAGSDVASQSRLPAAAVAVVATGGIVGAASQSPASQTPPEPQTATALSPLGPVSDEPGRYTHTSADLRVSTDRAAHGAAAPTSRLPARSIGYGIMGAGVVMLLDRLRRVQQRRRATGRRIIVPAEELQELERDLRVHADHDRVQDVDLGLRLLRGAVVDAAIAPPPVALVRCCPDSLEFVLGPESRRPFAPAPFEASSTGDTWHISTERLRLEGSTLSQEASADVASPALVTIASDASTTVLVDLENVGSVSVTGREASMMLQGMVVELSTLPWADAADVIVAGHRGTVRGLDRVRTVQSLARLVPEIAQRVSDQGALVPSHAPRFSDGRWSRSEACWDPMVLVCLSEAAEAEPDAVARLVELVGDGSCGVAVVVGAPLPGTRWSIRADGGPVEWTGRGGWGGFAGDGGHQLTSGRASNAQPVPVDVLQRVDDLVAQLKSTSTHPEEPPVEAVATDDCTIEIRVLGPVDVAGLAHPFTRAWCLELVVFLAMHPAGATTEAWSFALWPDRQMAPASLHSTASAARRALGVSTSGTDHLPRSHGRLRLGPGCTSDWARFRERARSDAPQDWESALELVRGRPFDGLRAGGDWPILEGIQAEIEAGVVDLASRLAEHYLTAGDPRRAEHAARRGLLVSSYDERLYRILLRAADASGNPAGVESTMRELLRLVAEDVEPFDAVHPETLELYRALSRGSGARRGA